LAGAPNAYANKDTLPKWLSTHNRLMAGERKKLLGEWMLRSIDGGKTWSAMYPTIVNSPHGPIQLKDGRLLYPGKQLWTPEKKVGVCESLDDGVTWRWLAKIPARGGDLVEKEYHELHGVEANDGRIVVHIRKEKNANAGETLQTESSDGGKTWSVPRALEVKGMPSHLLKLNDGRLLMTYGYRHSPFGVRVRISSDNGNTWGGALPLGQEAISSDLGYPSTVQFPDGRLLTVWYERMRKEDSPVLRQARWKLL
jgi:predicted neuraminidase